MHGLLTIYANYRLDTHPHNLGDLCCAQQKLESYFCYFDPYLTYQEHDDKKLAALEPAIAVVIRN